MHVPLSLTATCQLETVSRKKERKNYNGVFAPASPDRGKIVPRTYGVAATERGEAAATGRQRAMSWAQRLKRVFAIDIETCSECGGKARVIGNTRLVG